MIEGPPAGAVLAGGASRRMGTDKATLEVDGRALGRRAVDALRGAGLDRIVVVGGSDDLGGELVADLDPGSGPLGGLVTALAATAPADLIVLPCDLPTIDAATVAHLLRSGVDEPADVVVGAVDGRPAWPIGIWRRSAAAALSAAFDAGERSVIGAVRRLAVVTVELGARARDADFPEDLPVTGTLGAGSAQDQGGAG